MSRRREIEEMFAELSGSSWSESATYEASAADARRRADAVERVRLWRLRNPKRARELLRESRRRWVAKNPDKVRDRDRRRRARDPEKFRAYWRRSSAKYYGKKK